MNIIVGLVVFAAALYMRLKHRGQGQSEKQLFFISMAAGVVSILTIESYATLLQMLWPVVDITLCTLILFCYHSEIKRQEAMRAELSAQRAKERKAAASAAAQTSYQAHLLSRASIIAMCEYTEKMAARENAA